MTHFTSKDDLITWMIKSIKRNRELQRALTEGKIENLGGFSQVPPSNNRGIIVRVTSIHKKEYLMSITYIAVGKCGIFLIDSVPWKYWHGDKFHSKLIQGDNPEEYKELRDGKII